MKLRKASLAKIVLSALVPIALVACGDDVTNTDVTNVTGAKTVADLAAAGKCDSSALGDLVLNAEDGGLYACNGKKWLSTAGESAGEIGCELNSVTVDGVEGVEIVCGDAKDTVLNGAKCDKGNPGNPGNPGAAGTICSARTIDGVGVEITCDGAVIDTLKNGAKGDPGDPGTICTGRKIAEGYELTCDGAIVDTLKNGAPGEAGTSCTAEPYDDGVETGVVVSCDGVAIDTILNGAKGDPGEAGASCTGRSIAGVGIEVSCGGVVIDTLKNGASNARFCGETLYNVETHFCDERDKKVYKWIRIGDQVWMGENLNYDYKIDGASYGSYCYKNSADSCAKYGRHYTWAAAMDTAVTGCGYRVTCAASAGRVQGICPDGFHLPDTAEMNELLAAVAENLDTAGTALKTTEGWANNGNGTNSSGFAWLPAGFKNSTSTAFGGVGTAGHLWSSVQYSSAMYAYRLTVNDANTNVISYHDDRRFGYSVRCVQD